MHIFNLFLLSLACFLLNACQPQTKTSSTETDIIAYAKAQWGLGHKIGFDAYIYAFPLVEMDRVRQTQVKYLPENTFIHRRTLLTPKYNTVVAPNNDTLYSGGWLDLQNEPLTLAIPDTNGRYYSVALYDAYTNAFKIISRRTHGSQSQTLIITGPEFKEPVPENTLHIQAPTSRVWALVRIGIEGAHELQTVNALQSQFLITPLSDWRASGPKPYDQNLDDKVAQLKALQNKIAKTGETALNMQVEQLMSRFLERWVNDPSRVSHEIVTRNFAQINLTPGNANWRLTDSPIHQGARAGMEAARDYIHASFAYGRLHHESGWDIETELGDFGDDLFMRAIVSRGYIGALPAKEALYPLAWTDQNGEALNGKNAYILHFDAGQLPPVKAFWSLTMYDAKDSFLVENALERYAVGSFTQRLSRDADGGLDIFIQHTDPGEEKSDNWLPAPPGNFFLIMRYYEPDAAILNGAYQTPPVVKVL